MGAENKQTILICDDEKGIRASLELILSDDYELLFADDGPKAIELVESNQNINLVLLDIKMPKVHGIEVLKQIKSINSELPVIIVTGYQSAEIAQEAVKQGAANYIPKPFESDQLLKTVSQTLTKSV